MESSRTATPSDPADRVWGPQFRGQFDFTLVFEQSMFAILPACFLLGAAPIQLQTLLRLKPCVRPGLLLWAKLVLAVALVGYHATSIYFWTRPPYSTEISLAASVFSFAAALCSVALVYVEHVYSITPSALVSLYLTLVTVFDAAKARSCFLRDGLQELARLQVAIAAFEFFLLILLEVSKRRLLVGAFPSQVGDETLSGFWSRRLFLWINSTLLLGFRSILKVQDLPVLGPEFDSATLHAKFREHWDKADHNTKFSLGKACFFTAPWQFCLVIVPRLCYTGFRFAQPFLIRRVLEFVADGSLPEEATSGLIGAAAIIYVGMGISKACYEHLTYRFSTYMRGILVTEMCHKVLTLQNEELRESAILTLMTTDIAGVERICVDFHNSIASLIELGLGLFVLTGVVGEASFCVLIPTALATFVLSFITKRIGKARGDWNQKTQERVAATSLALQQIKNIKATGIDKFVANHLQELRQTEIDVSLSERRCLISMYATRQFSNGFTPVVVIAAALFLTSSLTELGIPNIFTALSVVSITMAPLSTTLVALPYLSAGIASLGRIQDFFDTESYFDAPQSILQEDSREPTQLPVFELELSKASIHNYGHDSALFKHLNLKIDKGQICMVVGKVGCGKSSFLKALAGELRLSAGSAKRSAEPIGYCDQVPWIEDTTILANILGHSELKEEWLNVVLEVCALHEDIAQLDGGILTQAGTGGCRLSGGQKGRLSVARAIYPQPRVMILDDVLAPLDETTAHKILSRLLGQNGLLRNLEITVIMSTSGRDHLKYADFVFVFNGDGSFSKVPPSSSVLNDIVGNSMLRDNAEPPAEEQEQVTLNVPQTERQVMALQEVDETSRQRGDKLLYGYYIKSLGLAAFCLWLLLAIIAAATARLPAIYIRIWLDKAPTNSLYIIGFALAAITHILLVLATVMIFFLKLIPRSSENLHWSALQAFMNAPLNFLSLKDNGAVINIFSQDMGLISQVLPMKFAEFIYECTTLVTDVGVIASGATYAGFIVPFCFGLIFVIQKVYLRTSRQVRLIDIEAKTPLYGKLVDAKDSMPHIRAFGWQMPFIKDCVRLIDYSQRPYYMMFCIQRWLTVVLDLSVAAIAVILITCAVKFRQTTSQTAIGLALVNLTTFSESLSKMITWWIQLETSLGAVSRIKAFIDTTPAEKTVPDDPGDAQLQRWPANGTIQLQQVASTYSTPTNACQVGIDDFTMTIPDGKEVSVVGRTGSGKSSLIMTMLNTTDFTGQIKIGGLNLRSIPLERLRDKIITVPQEGVELPGSVRTNIDPYRRKGTHTSQSDDVIVSILTELHVWDHILQRGGLDADFSKVDLSKGQKQLVFLARAILRRQSTQAKIVFMDEATSSIDEETEKRVRDFIHVSFAGCTVVNVTHRAAVAQRSDIVLELSRGQIRTELRRRSDQQPS